MSDQTVIDIKMQLIAVQAELNQVNGELAAVCAKNSQHRKQLYNILCDASRAQASILTIEHSEAIPVKDLNPVLFALQSIIRTAQGG